MSTYAYWHTLQDQQFAPLSPYLDEWLSVNPRTGAVISSVTPTSITFQQVSLTLHSAVNYTMVAAQNVSGRLPN
jgi:hypothetical protein